MPDNDIDGLIKHLDRIAQILDTILQNTRQATPAPPAPSPNLYLSGRWHRRDGDSYGIVQAQPKLKLPEPESADDPSGDIRPPHIR
jgi:hypothetical protein